jgi:predicted metalloprotease with PDZ domain
MSFRYNLERMAEIYEGIAIFSVDKGSTTHRAGVRAGDILVAVNGRRVRRLSEYATARKLREDLIELVVVRDGRQLQLWAGHHPAKERLEETIERQQAPEFSQTPQPVTCPWRGAA